MDRDVGYLGDKIQLEGVGEKQKGEGFVWDLYFKDNKWGNIHAILPHLSVLLPYLLSTSWSRLATMTSSPSCIM